MTRKEFITLTFTLIGSAAAVGACSDDTNTTGVGGSNGAGGTYGSSGHGGTTGTGGHAGTTGAGGTGTAGATGHGGAGGTGTAACTDPLPETQDADQTGHIHSVVVMASLLSSTSDQVITTTSASGGAFAGHTHSVTLTPANLATLKAGGSVDAPSSINLSHMHMFTISCH